MCKKVIENQKAKGTLDRDEMLTKLNTFLLARRITGKEYEELAALMHDENGVASKWDKEE